MSKSYQPGTELAEVALFPLPQVVLFPGAEMPLHVFEPRYRAMTRDVLASTGRICVVQIPEDHVCSEYRKPRIARVAGIGEIAKWDALPDGRFNIIVTGMARVELEELPFRHPYRRAQARIIGSTGASVDPALVRALSAMASRVAHAVRECHPGFRFTLPSAAEPGALADACSHYLVLDGTARQDLLETLDVGKRVERCLSALTTQLAEFGECDPTVH